MKFTINSQAELTPELLQKMIETFQSSVQPVLTKYKNYYDGVQAISLKQYSDPSKPCNKTVVNYCKNIVDGYNGYLASPNFISYTSDHDIEAIMDVLRYNDFQAEDSDFLESALIYGVGVELMFSDQEGKTRFKLIDPRTCFGVYDDSLTGDLLYFVRMYKEDEWDEDNDTQLVDVYSDYNIRHYKMSNGGAVTFINEEPHYFGQCPANIFYLPDEKSIFDCIMSLQDSVNELLSDEIDDYSAFCDAYLTLTGVDCDNEEIALMKQNRVLVLPEGAVAEWLTKNANDAQVENILKRLHDDIYRIAQMPDFCSETFVGGVSSGIALRFRLTGMENRAGRIEALMKQALQRRIELICGIASLKLGEEVFRDIQITFKRNIPNDETQVYQMVNMLKGTVSDETLLGQLPFISDVNAELERVKEQKANNIELYSFGIDKEEDSEDE